MRISAKGRYALAATISMAQGYEQGAHITVLSISEKLGISKIYLEQVFSLLKRGDIVVSAKGAQGGYMLSRAPGDISACQVLLAVETALFENTEATVAEKAPQIDTAMRTRVFDALDCAVKASLQQATLSDLAREAEKLGTQNGLMFFI